MVKEATAPPNPSAGVLENKWVAAHRDELKRYAVRWIAVLGDTVIVDAPSIVEVHTYLRRRSVMDALVLKVRVDSGKLRLAP